MSRVQVQLTRSGNDNYDIVVERGLLRRLSSDIRMLNSADDYVVITDSTVNRHYGSAVVEQLKKAELFRSKIVVPTGEKSKSLAQMEEVLEKLVECGAHRKTGIIALGGGVVGDLAGFVAASYMRGVALVQIPTSLLAMVDSSVGGKVAVDLPSGKNLVGAFWQPKKVFVDPDVLKTLAMKQWKAGLGEAVKYGAIADRKLWEFFEQYVEVWNTKPSDFLPSHERIVDEMIFKCIAVKADVVMKDEKEGNYRKILNYGHTFGHVVEKMSDYKVLHGEAVALGMRMAADLAVALRFMRAEERDRQGELLGLLGIGKSKVKGLISEFIDHMKSDKKAKGDLQVVLVDRLGRCYQRLGKFGIEVEKSDLVDVLKSYVDDKAVEKKPVPTVSTSSYMSSSLSASPPSWQSPTPSSSYASPSLSSSSPESEETELQRRLRLMRERRAERQAGGGSSGGFLPG